jgi:periplasmic copper chaperone A
VPTSSRRFVVAVAAVAAALALTLVPTSVAVADVIVSPSSATQGDYTTLTFVIPNESENATTTKVKVAFPTKPTLASVRVKRQPGWTTDVIKTKVRGPGDTCECTPTRAAAASSPASSTSSRCSWGPCRW